MSYKNIELVEDKRSGLEKLADMLDRHYENEGESMFILNIHKVLRR